MAENQDLGKKVKRVKGEKAKQPEFYESAVVICNGQEVMSVGGTQKEYVVDIWSGNHPFFQGKKGAIMTDIGQVSRFGNKYGDLGELSAFETVEGKSQAGEAKQIMKGGLKAKK
jgi:large subunit ribosomal protein L31